MNWLLPILSLYLLVLSGLPCSDYAGSGRMPDHQHETTEGHAHDETDHCSPFCHCTCCGITIAPALPERHTPEPERGEIPPQGPVTIANSAFIATYSDDIWQPPRLRA